MCLTHDVGEINKRLDKVNLKEHNSQAESKSTLWAVKLCDYSKLIANSSSS